MNSCYLGQATIANGWKERTLFYRREEVGRGYYKQQKTSLEETENLKYSGFPFSRLWQCRIGEAVTRQKESFLPSAGGNKIVSFPAK